MSKLDKYKITVTIMDADASWYNAVSAENNQNISERSSLHFTHDKGITTAHVSAQDAVALKAIVNAIAKHAIIIEEMKTIQ